MKKAAYDLVHASRLVPLLKSIGLEINERAERVRLLEGRLRTVTRDRSRGDAERRLLEAELFLQRRELRITHRELARLGCEIDEEHAFRILIPGEDGELDGGFALTLGSVRVDASLGTQPGHTSGQGA